MQTVILIVFLLGISCAMAQSPPGKKRTGVSNPHVRIPIQKLVPDAVYEVPGNPDWLAIDEKAWVSSASKHLVAQMDPKTNKATLIAVGKEPGNGLAAAFGSLWVPNCCESTMSRIELSTGRVTATFPMTFAGSGPGTTHVSRLYLPDH